eukprot:343704-Pyramimonas_sp.AAC.1
MTRSHPGSQAMGLERCRQLVCTTKHLCVAPALDEGFLRLKTHERSAADGLDAHRIQSASRAVCAGPSFGVDRNRNGP